MKKRLVSLLLSIIMLFSLTTALDFSAYAYSYDSVGSVSLNNKIENNEYGYYTFSAPHSGYYKLSIKITRGTYSDTSARVTVGTMYECKHPDWDYEDESDYYRPPTYHIEYHWNSDYQNVFVYNNGEEKTVYFEATTYDAVKILISNGWSRYDSNIKYELVVEESDDYFRETYEDGLYYRLNMDTRTASVVGPTSERCIYTIPAQIEYGNRKYTVDSIDDYAFKGCLDLCELYLPETIKHIGKAVFADDEKLKIVDTKYNGYFKYQNGVLFNSRMTELVWYPSYLTNESYTIPNTVREISSGAFFGAKNLKNVVIPSTVTYIDDYTFENTGLRSIDIPDSVVYIGKSAFANNVYAKNINLGNNVEEIVRDAFNNCSIVRSVTIPESTAIIGDNAFAKCSKLTAVYIKGTDTKFADKVFDACPESLTIYAPYRSTAMYYADDENIYYSALSSECNHSFHLLTSVESTCDNKGYKFYECNNCKERFIESIDKKDHLFETKEIDSTCTSEGVIIYTCKICNTSYTEEIAKKKHTVVIDKAVAPTYTKTGKTEGSHCSVCKTVIKKQETVAKKTLAKPTSVKATAQSKGFKLTWKKVSAAKGYEIQYSTSSSFSSPKKLTISSASTVSKTVTKLTAKKKYYVRIRSYYKDSNGTAYSSWVSTSVTTKK